MKTRLIFFLILIFNLQGITAQEKRILLFENYEKGTVLFKNKTQTHASFNFDAANDKIMFMQGNEEMILTNINIIDTIYISSRKFIPIKNIYVEWRSVCTLEFKECI